MAAPSDSDDALLISSEEIKLSTEAEDSESDSLFAKNLDAGKMNQRHSNTEQANNGPGRFVALTHWVKVLFRWWRTLVIIFTPLILLLLFVVAEDTQASRAAYAILIITVYWITEACSITVTALLPLVLFPCLGVIDSMETAASYMSDTNMLFVGGLMMAVAFEKQQLHRRIALLVLLAVGSKPYWLLFGFMITTGFLSMWISNTATAAMILPIAHAVLQEIGANKKKPQHFNDSSNLEEFDSENLEDVAEAELQSPVSPTAEISTRLDLEDNGDDSIYLDKDVDSGSELTYSSNSIVQEDTYNTFEDIDRPKERKRVRFQLPKQSYSDKKLQNDKSLKRLSKALMLGVAYAANIGGTATLTGTGPNLVLKGDIAKCFPDSPNIINFGNWFVYGVPQMLLILLIAWLYLSALYCSNNLLWCRRICCGGRVMVYSLDHKRAKKVVRKEYKKLGPIRCGEIMVGFFFVVLALLWLLREPKFVKGWSTIFSSNDNTQSYVSDTTTVMFIVFLLFVLPSKSCVICQKRQTRNCRRCYQPNISREALYQSGSSDKLLDWQTVQRNLPWNVVLLLGSGFALATGAQQSGLSRWIGGKLHNLEHLATGGIAFLITIIITTVTEVMSNVATTTLLLPILAELAISLEVNPLYFMIPATVSASFAFMLPVATPPNTMAFSYQYLRVTDMMQLHTRVCEELFTRVIKPNPSSRGNSLKNLHNLVLTGFLMNILSILVVALCLNTYGVKIFDIQSELPHWANTTSCTA